MLSVSLFVTFVVVLVTYFLWNTTRRPKNYPPGPPLLPIVGYLPFMDKSNPYKTLTELRQKYGSVFSLKFGSQNIVYLSDFHLAKQLFNDPGFLARPRIWSFKFSRMNKLAGILLNDGPSWKEHRRFALRHLRDFGFGKTSLEGVIMASIDELAQEFQENNEQPFSPSLSINLAIVNVIWHMVASIRLNKSDPHHMKLLEIVDNNVQNIEKRPPNYFPWLLYLPEKILGIPEIRKRRDMIYNSFQELIDEHKRTFDSENLRDLIDVYLKEMKEEEAKGNKDSSFDMHTLLCVLRDMFVAGSDTTSTSIKFAFIYLVNYPDVQDKIQQEIRTVLGTERNVSLNDKKSLPYLEAFIYELLRCCDTLPLGVPHAAATDVNIGEYRIPKGTTISLFQKYIHRDPTYWCEPEKFDPSRFLDSNGNLLTKLDGYVPFSIGKRQCLGEIMAKAQLFLFLGCLLQRFTFCLPPGSPPIDESEAIPGIVMHPPEYQIIATPNSKSDQQAEERRERAYSSSG